MPLVTDAWARSHTSATLKLKGERQALPTTTKIEVTNQPKRQSHERGKAVDYYLDAVLDGDAGERVHPGNLVLQAVVMGRRRRGRGRRPLRREDGGAEGVVLVRERVRDAHGQIAGEERGGFDGQISNEFGRESGENGRRWRRLLCFAAGRSVEGGGKASLVCLFFPCVGGSFCRWCLVAACLPTAYLPAKMEGSKARKSQKREKKKKRKLFI